jgi:hypothetical protein
LPFYQAVSKKKPFKKKGFGGIERIRTAVAAFAELSLASRPQYHLPEANIHNIITTQIISSNNLSNLSLNYEYKRITLQALILKIV